MPNVMVALPNIGGEAWRTQSELCTWQNSVTRQEPPKMYMYCSSPGDGQTPCKVWLASVEQRCCSNAKPVEICSGAPNYRTYVSR